LMLMLIGSHPPEGRSPYRSPLVQRSALLGKKTSRPAAGQAGPRKLPTFCGEKGIRLSLVHPLFHIKFD
jgi:hypothetical protein